MADAMVTARMSQEKKDAVNDILGQLGTNASQVVNRLYDYVIEKKELPFPDTKKKHSYTAEEIAEAAAFIDSIAILPVDNRFRNMTSKEIKIERLKSRDLIDA
jgi:addiction module RelB/DinJ family antitoxin